MRILCGTLAREILTDVTPRHDTMGVAVFGLSTNFKEGTRCLHL